MKSSLFQAADRSRASSLPRHLAKASIATLVLTPPLLYGQVVSGPGAEAQAAVAAPNTVVAPNTAVAPKRLSDWLQQQPVAADDYPLGLSWRVQGEVAAQSELRLDLLQNLSGVDREIRADRTALSRLRDWVSALPVTGRVPVAVPDARWLQANPARDPVLQPGYSVVLPKRPRTVTVVTARGTRCSVAHSAGYEAMAYIHACSPTSSRRVDRAWVAQPDGRVQRFGVAAWNRETQDEPAPGAWIWAPPRDGGFPDKLSQRLIAFLATQGPAPDRGTGISVGPAGSAPASRVYAPQPAPERVSEAVAPSALPEPGGTAAGTRDRTGLPDLAGMTQGVDERKEPSDSQGTAQGPRDRKDPAVSGAPDSDTTAVLPPPTLSGRSSDLATTASDWGGVGLLQTPSARMEKPGHLSVNFSRTTPYLQANIMVQPLDWLETGFRYTSVSNRLFGPADFSGNQSYLDKSFDAKFRLLTESAYLPQVALGLRDIAGTGLFSGEYLVANKRTGAFDWSLGLGWGYVGGRGNLRNPIGLIKSSFDTRKSTDVATGGNFSFGSYFHGPTALFGGVQYQTPWAPLILKLEYDGNDYQHEPQANNQRQSSPLNFGLVYRAGRAVDVTLGVERGNTAMFGITLHTQLDGLSTPKPNDPPRVAVTANRPQQAPDWSATSRDIAAQTGWHVRRIEQRGRELRLTLDDAEAVYWRERAERAAAVLNRDAPATVDRFALVYRQHGVDVAEHIIERDAWVAQQTQPVPPSERRATVIARAPERAAPQAALYQDTRPMLETSLGPNYQQTLGGPDGFLLFQVGAVEQAKLRLREDTWLQGTVQLGLIDNYNKFNNRGSSDLPRVRTFLREYVTTSKLTLPNLQATHVGKLAADQFYSLYGGYLEPMFAGVGGEWLYRPFASRVAFGIDANVVQQRDFQQDFGFGNVAEQTHYRVATGHATLYWDTGWNNVQANLSAGRYLAKDIGVTVGMSRVFQNGVRLGAFFTRTDVSAARFGEGSFDKGVFLSVPFDAFLTRSSNSIANVVWKPLTRDGGAKLNRSVELYDFTSARDNRSLRYKAAPPPNDESIPADRREAWSPPSAYADADADAAPRGALIDITPELIRQQRAAQATDVGQDVKRLFGVAKPYQIGPGDVLNIVVWDHPELELRAAGASSGTDAASLSGVGNGYNVSPAGLIQFPYAGSIKLGALTEYEARDLLESRLAKYFKDPQVTVRIQAYRSGRIYVDGEVGRPGSQAISDIPATLPEVISRAGGFTAAADRSTVAVSRNGSTTVINMQQLTALGIRPDSILLSSGDLLRVLSREESKVYVMGEVLRPIAQPLRNGRLTLNEALGEAGGVNPISGDPRQIYVVRSTQGNQPEIYHLDARSPMAFALAEGFELKSRDVVYVDPAPLVRWNRVLSLIVPSAEAIIVTNSFRK